MITAVIQAGGSSRRMGRDKAFVKLNGTPLVEHVIRRLADIGDETLIVTNHPQGYSPLGIRTVSDAIPSSGALVGLYSALYGAHGDTVLVVACDMPFLSRALLEYQLQLAPQADVVVPLHQNYYEPLHAVYDRRVCLHAVEELLQAGEERVVSLYPHVRVLTVGEAVLDRLDPSGLSFFNVNTPQDLARAEGLIADGAVVLD
jgi:molybdopterin-guanine dinucleotide biosynthesis protein A